MTRAALALALLYAFHTAMMADRAALCGNDATAYKECSK